MDIPGREMFYCSLSACLLVLSCSLWVQLITAANSKCTVFERWPAPSACDSHVAYRKCRILLPKMSCKRYIFKGYAILNCQKTGTLEWYLVCHNRWQCLERSAFDILWQLGHVTGIELPFFIFRFGRGDLEVRGSKIAKLSYIKQVKHAQC